MGALRRTREWREWRTSDQLVTTRQSRRHARQRAISPSTLSRSMPQHLPLDPSRGNPRTASPHYRPCSGLDPVFQVRCPYSACGSKSPFRLTPTSSSPSNLPLPSNTDTFDGELTYYAPGLGACGLTSTAQDDIVSLSHLLFDAAGSSSSKGGNSNENPLCERKLRARRFNEGADEWRSVDLRVVDRCTGCAPRDLDVSEAVFKKLAEINDGRVEVEWAWLDGEGDGEA